jgi:hypothetical protein
LKKESELKASRTNTAEKVRKNKEGGISPALARFLIAVI